MWRDLLRLKLIWLAAAAIPGAALAQTPPPAPAPKPAGSAVGEVVITGQAPAMRTSIDRRSYDVARDLQAQTGSIGDALRNVPSVEVDVQGNVSLRGDSNVTILVDGKPSGQFRGEGKGQALQALPAERIERVEVLTNPSAEFRADGTGGVINLVTKKAKGAGTTASARLTAGSGERVFASGAIGHNSGSLSLAADAFFRHEPQRQAVDEDRARLEPATGSLAETRLDMASQVVFDVMGARASADYDLNDRTRLNGELRVQRLDFENESLNAVERENGAGQLVEAFDREIRVDQDRRNAELSAGVRRKFDDEGHELSLSASYEITDYLRVRTGGTFGRLPPAAPAFDRQNVQQDLEQIQIKGDYVRPMGETAKLKAGFDVQWDDNSYRNRGFRGPSAPASIPDPTLSNLFQFEQRIAQAYVTYEQRFGDVTVLAGLRAEDVRIDLRQVSQGQADENDYVRAYPSLHASWKLSDAQTFTASYSQRVQRPDPEEFNSFRFLLDPLTYRSGNPDLDPQRTQSFELGWQYRKAPANYLATFYYRENDKVVTEVTRDLGGGVLLITRDNVSATRAAGLELVANGRLSPTLSFNVSGNGYWNELDASALGIPDRRSTFALGGRGSLTWQATPDDTLQLNGFINAKRLTAQGYTKPTGMLNLGYRHKFSDRITGLVTAQDLLNTFEQTDIIDTPALQTRSRRSVGARAVMVGFVWTLGAGKSRDQGFDFGGGGSPPQ
jgi:outer membrane receptor protein involved in Fe transport